MSSLQKLIDSYRSGPLRKLYGNIYEQMILPDVDMHECPNKALVDMCFDMVNDITRVSIDMRRGALVNLPEEIEFIDNSDSVYSFSILGDVCEFVITPKNQITMDGKLVSILSPLNFRRDVLDRDPMKIARSGNIFNANHVPLMIPHPNEEGIYRAEDFFTDDYVATNPYLCHVLLYIINDHIQNYKGYLVFHDTAEESMGMLLDSDGIVEFFGSENGDINIKVAGEA